LCEYLPEPGQDLSLTVQYFYLLNQGGLPMLCLFFPRKQRGAYHGEASLSAHQYEAPMHCNHTANLVLCMSFLHSSQIFIPCKPYITFKKLPKIQAVPVLSFLPAIRISLICQLIFDAIVFPLQKE